MTTGNDPVSAILSTYLRQAGIRLSAKTLKEYLRTQTLRNTLRGISDTLDHFHIPNMVIHIGPDDLRELEGPALVEMNLTEEPFGIFQKIEGDKITVLFPKSGLREMPVLNFAMYWTGNVLGVEKSEHTIEDGKLEYCASGVISFVENHIIQLLAGSLFLTVILILIKGSYSVTDYIYFALKAGGLVLSALILYKTFADKSFLESFCKAGKNIDCRSVLESKGSKIFNWLGIGELSFIYFSGSILWGLVSGNPTGIFATLSVAAFLAVVYSIVYQAFFEKKWCLLCLGIDAVLAGELVTTFATGTRLQLHLWPLVLLILVFISVSLIWLVIKDYYLAAKHGESAELRRSYFVADSDVFNYLISRQPAVSVSDEVMVLAGGNEPAKGKLIFITNPSCPKCRKLYGPLLTVSDQYNIGILLHIFPNDTAGEAKALEAIRKYNEGGLRSFIEFMQSTDKLKANEGGDYTKEREILLNHQQFLNKAGFNSVPMVLIDGKPYPYEYYDLAELKYFL